MLGLWALRRTGSRVLAGIAVGAGGSGVIGFMTVVYSSLVYTFA